MHKIRGPSDDVPRRLPAIGNWDSDKVKRREEKEITNGGFGEFDEDEEQHEQQEEVVIEKTREVNMIIIFVDILLCT